MQQKLFVLLVICAFGVVVACAHTQRQQSQSELNWLAQPPAGFATDNYVTAIGSGNSPEVAADNARAAIAQLFSVRVRHTSYQAQQVGAHDGQEERVRTYGGKSSRSVTDQVLRGVPIVRQGLNQADGRWYALAALDKSATARQLRRDMDALDGRIAQLLQQLSASKSLKQVALLKQAEALMEERTTALDRHLILVRSGYPSEHVDYPFVAASAQARQAATIRITFIGEAKSTLKSTGIIAEIVHAQGYQVAATGAYSLTVRQVLSPVTYKKPWHWQKAQFDWYLCEGNQPQPIEQCTSGQMRIRAAATQPSLLPSRLQEQMRQELTAPLLQTFANS